MGHDERELLDYWITEAWNRLNECEGVILAQLTDDDFHIFELVKRVYLRPSTSEESIIRGEILDIFREIVRRSIRRVEEIQPNHVWTPWGGMDIGEAYRLIGLLNIGDPLSALAAQMHLARACSRMGESLAELIAIEFPSILPEHRRRLAA